MKLITSIASPSLSEAAVAEFLVSGGYDRHVRHMRLMFEQQVSAFSQAVSKYFPEGTKLSRPDQFPIERAISSLNRFRFSLSSAGLVSG